MALALSSCLYSILSYPILSGIGVGVLTFDGCINGYIDRALLPEKLCYGTFDPEGFLCSLSATGITLMGTFAGHILRNKKTGDLGKWNIY